MDDYRTPALSGKEPQRFLGNMIENLLFHEYATKRYFLIDISRTNLLDNLESSITRFVVSNG